jgi:O-antigen ligase
VVALWAGAGIAMVASGLAGASRPTGWSWLATAAVAYGFLIVTSTLLFGPVYSAAGLYHPLLILAGFVVVRSFYERAERAAAFAAILFAALLAIWGAADIALRGEGRAHALFETPATYATTLNLMLVPILANVMVAGCRAPLAVAAVLISAGVFIADSRGGFLAMAAGIGIAAVLALRVRLLGTRMLAFALALVVAGWAMGVALRTVSFVPSPGVPSAEAREESALSRLELYALSLNTWRDHPATGTGYLTFRYALEQGRATVPSYGTANETWFVHNDYLQTLQELGPLGLLALLGITAFPLLLAWRGLPALATGARPAVIACSAGLAAMSVHAMVDFPFYVPVSLLLYGALLGALDRRVGNATPAPERGWSASHWLRGARAAVIAVSAVILLRPVAAEIAAAWGLREMSRGDGRSAAFWLGAAKRIDPRDWRYHWYAGQFWDSQTMVSRKRENAHLAANAYAGGFDANPLEVRNLLGLISVHQRYRELLDAPADPATLRDWSARAAALAPLNPLVLRGLPK